MPKCSRCNAEKEANEFHRDRHAASGHRPNCKQCARTLNAEQWAKHNEKRRAAKRSYVAANKDAVAVRNREYKLSRQYGLSTARLNEMFDAQNGRCSICSDQLIVNRKGGLAVDHCHRSGNVRGLLCHRCNTGLGLFRDSRDLLARAAEYLGGNAIVPQVAAEVIAAFLEDERAQRLAEFDAVWPGVDAP